jgi:hypothetical protein
MFDNVSTFDNLKKRARAKFVTHSLASGLIKNGSKENEHAYQRILNCCSILEKKEDKLKAHYCNNRMCLVCSRIKTANLINGYAETIEKFANKKFITLTIPNCKDKELEQTLRKMSYGFSKLKRNIKKRYNITVEGIRHVEITYNENEKTFHPHYHIVINEKIFNRNFKKNSASATIVYYWLKQMKKEGIKPLLMCQDITQGNNGSVKELFKYFAKTIYKKQQRNGNTTVTEIRTIPPKQLDVIYTATYRKRMFQPFSIRKLKEFSEIENQYNDVNIKKIDVADCIDTLERKENLYYWRYKDWISQTGVLLSNYEPSEMLEKALKKKDFNFEGTQKAIIDKMKDLQYQERKHIFLLECAKKKEIPEKNIGIDWEKFDYAPDNYLHRAIVDIGKRDKERILNGRHKENKFKGKFFGVKEKQYI